MKNIMGSDLFLLISSVALFPILVLLCLAMFIVHPKDIDWSNEPVPH